MEKRFLCGEEVSLLGFGAMRLPTQEDGTIDRVKAGRLVDTLYQNGVNYFDTAYVYINGTSEILIKNYYQQAPLINFIYFFCFDKIHLHLQKHSRRTTAAERS